MKKKKAVVLSIIAVILLVIAGVIVYVIAEKKEDKRIEAIPTKDISKIEAVKIEEPVMLIAHRGLSSQAPENTLEALTCAGEAKYARVEFDIRQTGDGVWVLSHDDNIKRMTDSRGLISKMSYLEVLKCKIDNGANHEKYENLRIPNLNDALDICLTYNMIPVIDVKEHLDSGVDELLEILKSKGLNEKSTIICFESTVLTAIQKASPETELWLLTSKLDDTAIKFAKDNPKIGLSFDGNNDMNTDGIIKDTFASNINLATWTIDDEDTLKRLYSSGIRIFTTNVFVP